MHDTTRAHRDNVWEILGGVSGERGIIWSK